MKQSDLSWAIIFVGICLVIAAGLIGSRYQGVPMATGGQSMVGGGVYIVDRFTGDIIFCAGTDCRHAITLDLPK